MTGSDNRADQLRKDILVLITSYNNLRSKKGEKGLGELSEANVRKDFVDRLFEALGWKVRDLSEYDAESHVRGVGLADVAIKVNGRVQLFVEAKRFGGIPARTERGVQTTLSGYKIWADWTFEERQVLNYAGMSVGTKWAVLTNFEKFRLFNAKTGDMIINIEEPKEYLERIDDLLYLTEHNVKNGLINRLESRVERKDIDLNFLNSLNHWRLILANEIFKKFPDLDLVTIKKVVQRILDRFVIIRFAEDRWVLDNPDQLRAAYDYWRTTRRYTRLSEVLKSLFEGFNAIHDSRIFEKDDQVNAIIDKIEPAVIGEMIDQLYNQSFRKFTSDILGTTYESYLSQELVVKQSPLTKEKFLELVSDEQVRKSGGIYYTPSYVVRFIVDKTLEPALEGIFQDSLHLLREGRYDDSYKKIEELFSIKILDDACGSGSFLIKAWNVIRLYCERYNEAVTEISAHVSKQANESRKKGQHRTAWELESNFPILLTDYETRILYKCIFGVDIDAAAAEIAAVNLVLQSLKKAEKLPLILQENIKIGNSLISGQPNALQQFFADPVSKLPFDWEREFGQVLVEGKFSAVIGNPPYVTMEKFPEEQRYFQETIPEIYTGKSDMLYYFLHKGVYLLKQGGRLGYIVSRYFIEAAYANKLRHFLLDNTTIEAIIDFGNVQLFTTEHENINVLTTIIILQKEEKKSIRDSNKIRCVRVWKWSKSNAELIQHIEDHLSSTDFQDDSIEVFSIEQRELDDKPWSLSNPNSSRIKKKMMTNSDLLGELCDIEQSQKTGLNEAFIIDGQTITKWNLEKDLLRRVISNSEVKKYYIDWEGNYLIYTNDSTDIEKYPNVLKYLLQFKEQLEQRSETSEGLFPWWRLQRPRRESIFSAPKKIVVPFLSTENRFAYDEQEDEKGFYGTTDTYVLVPFESCKYDIMYILALLNSKCVEFYHKNSAKLKRDEYYEYSRTPLMKLPIASIDSNSTLYRALIQDATTLYQLKKMLYRSIRVFDSLQQNYGDINARDYPLSGYLEKAAEFSINMVETRKLIDDNTEGEVSDIEAKVRDQKLIISARFNTTSGTSEDILHIAIKDRTLLDYFFYAIRIFLMKNYKRRKWGKGKVMRIVLDSIKIKSFSNNIETSNNYIKKLMNDFYQESLIKKESMTDLEDKIQALQDSIDESAYKCYNLEKHEIQVINQFIQRQSTEVARTF